MTAVSRLLAGVLAASLVPAALSARPVSPPATVQSFDVSRRLDAGAVSFAHTNYGTLAQDFATNGPTGFYFPRGTSNGVMYASGLWLGGLVAGAPRVAVAEYSSEYGPGRVVSGLPDDPSRPGYVVWKVRAPLAPADTAHVERTPAELAADPSLDPLAHHGWGEYLANAAPLGAPVRTWRLPNTATPDPADSVDVPGPEVNGVMSTWCVFNDANPAAHGAYPGGTPPLGVEVRQSTWALGAPGSSFDKVVLVRWTIVNSSGADIESFRAALWADPDLGGATDDLVGWDVPTQMGYAYNGTNADAVYGAAPPAVGALFLSSPAVGMTTAQSFDRWINGADPQNAGETWNILNGYARDGVVRIDPTTGSPTRFDVSGDPLEGTGWIDTSPGDRRFLVVQELGTLPAGGSREVIAAYVVGSGANRLYSLAKLRCTADWLRQRWAAGFALPEPAPPTCELAVDCPRPSSWWAGACGGALFGPGTLFQIANFVDLSSNTLQWNSPLDGFCGTVVGSADARADALREYASLLANVQAGVHGLQPNEPQPVRLTGSVDVTCSALQAGTLAELIQPAPVTNPVALGRYVDGSPVHVGPGLAGVDAGLASFGGGAGAAFDFLAGIDPYAHPDSFPTVRITFDRAHPRAAYRYQRLELVGGGAPPIGRVYRYAGYVPTFLTAVDASTGDTLALAFAERLVTDEAGNALDPSYQPGTTDGTWLPDATDLGGREYLFVSKRPWTPTPDPVFQVDGAVLGDTPSWLYALWSRSTSLGGATIDDGDAFEFTFDLPMGPGADQALLALSHRPIADPAVQQAYARIAQCLGAINRGERSALLCDAPTAVLASLVSAMAQPGRVQLEWSVSATGVVSVERRPVGGAWAVVAQIAPDGVGRVAWEDTDVAAGSAYDYRVRIGDATAGDVRVTVPGAFRLALAGLRPNPATAASSVVFSLASHEPATLEMLDVAGRRVWSRTLRAPEPGAQVLGLADARLAPGVYLVRLTQGRDRAFAKAVIVR